MAEDQKRVLHIMSSFGGGISTFIQNLAVEAPSYKMMFDVATYHQVPDPFLQRIESSKGQVFYLQNPKEKGWSAFQQSFNNILLTHSYSAVYCHIAGYRALIYYRLIKKHSPQLAQNFYIHAHYKYSNEAVPLHIEIKRRWDQRINASLSKEKVGCSHQAISALFSLKAGENFIVIPNSIEPSDWVKSSAVKKSLRKSWRDSWGLSEEDLVIAQVGRLEAVKNHAFTFQLIKQCRSLKQTLYLIVAGEGKLEEQLKRQVKEAGLDSQIKFLGRIHPLADLFPAVDAVILPSFSEGLGTIAIEAQAAGLPTIASDAVSHEVDLKLGLVKRISLEAPHEHWCSEIMTLIEEKRKNSFPSSETRVKRIQDKKFTNQAATQLFRKLLDQEIKHFQLD